MQVPPEIAYRGVEKTGQLDQLIQTRIAKLEKICDYIVSCHIVIEQSQNNQQSGNPFRVRILVRVPPGHELVSDRISTRGKRGEPLPALIRRSFDAMEKQLQELVEKQRNDIKTHPTVQTNALVESIFRNDGYGFLRSLDGRQIYFHKNSVLHNEFERLEIGTGVRFSEEMGEMGLQATTVEIENKPGSNISAGKISS
jgi:cold shock CspA family protein